MFLYFGKIQISVQLRKILANKRAVYVRIVTEIAVKAEPKLY